MIYLEFPKLGTKIQGTITAINDLNISCSVMDIVRAEIPLINLSPKLKPIRSHDSNTSETEIRNESGHLLQIGETFEFELEDVSGQADYV